MLRTITKVIFIVIFPVFVTIWMLGWVMFYESLPKLQKTVKLNTQKQIRRNQLEIQVHAQ